MRFHLQSPFQLSRQRSGNASRRTFLSSAASGLAAVTLAAAAGVRADDTVTVIQFSPEGKKLGKTKLPRVTRSEADWQRQLSPIAFEVTRHAATEQPYTGGTWNLHDKGLYRCICCDLAVFRSETKFESGTGWPSFWQPIARENVVEIKDSSLGMTRTAVTCRLCDAHLGHVFDDGPRPTGERYCMNSAAMKFVKQA
jgi:peptide-methionine (R)-S-oxide reductase